MSSPTLAYDPDVRALYITFSDAVIVETVELSRTVYVDLDADGNPVGFEVLDADPALVAKVPALPDVAALRDLVKPDAA